MKKIILSLMILSSTFFVCYNLKAQTYPKISTLNHAFNYTDADVEFSITNQLKHNWEISTRMYEKSTFRDNYHDNKYGFDVHRIGFELGATKHIDGTVITFNVHLDRPLSQPFRTM
jgi:hypothetical protein